MTAPRPPLATESQNNLADAALLQKFTIIILSEKTVQGLYQQMVAAAVTLLQADGGSLHLFESDLAGRGFLNQKSATGKHPEVALHIWNEIQESQSAMSFSGETIPSTLQASGASSMHAIPLRSSGGAVVGVLTTWSETVHKNASFKLHLLEMLLRQAGEMITRAEETDILRRSEDRLRALTTATSNLVYRMSPDWREMYQLDGRNFLTDVVGPVSDWVEHFIYPPDKAIVLQTIQEACRSLKDFRLEHRVIQANGEVGWVSSRAVPIKDGKGELVEWFGAATDITGKREFLSELERKIEERTIALKHSNEDLQQFAHVASHDLKEPIRKMSMLSSLLQNELSAEAAPKAYQYVQKIRLAAARMTNLIDGILSYSVVNATEQMNETIDLNEIINDIQNDLDLLIREKSGKIESTGLPEVEGVRVLIHQLFFNLIIIALKFSKPTEPPRISFKASRADVAGVASTMITVSDNGIGFEPEFNDSIFRSFSRLNPKSTHEGTGLGLSLIRKIAARHHGSIFAEGMLGEGAVFTLALPLRQPAPGRSSDL